MEETKTYENFPIWIVLLSNLVAVSIYALGVYIFLGFGFIVALLYLLYCLWAEAMVLRRSCVDCYYYGKVCGLGKGKLVRLCFKPGNPQKFAEREISWTALIPDFMVSIFPLIGGIILLLKDFNWPILIALIALVALSLGGNAAVRGPLVCKYCRQREIGCPAQKMFGQAEDKADKL